MATRRDFLKTSSSLAALAPFGGLRQARRNTPPGRVLAYVGTYSAPQGAAPGRGQGIHVFEVDPSSGALTPRGIAPNASSPAWLAFGGDRTCLYSANESEVQGTGAGSVSAYAIDAATGQLTPLNTVSSQGAGPAHLSVHPAGRHVLVANYGGGSVAVLAIQPDGSLGAPTDTRRHEGTPGAAQASSGPSGSFAISGHDRPHAHMIEADPDGRFVFAADLGLDRLFCWRFDPAVGKLTPNEPPAISLPAGDGPRHFAFHPSRRWFYSLQEEASTITAFAYDHTTGQLSARQTVSTLPRGFAGTNFTSEIVISRDGRFVYAANRLHDSIAWFAVGPDGTLTWRGEEWTRGDYPRSFGIEPGGRFLFSCNQRSDAVACFRIDPGSGALTFTGRYTPVGSPAHIVFRS